MVTSLKFYKLLMEMGVSGNNYDAIVNYLYANIADIGTAIAQKKLRRGEATRKWIAKGMELEGGSLPTPKPIVLQSRDAPGVATTFSAAKLNVSYLLRQHLLDPFLRPSSVVAPPTGHCFAGAGQVDNFCNSPAGLEFNAWWQKRWSSRKGGVWDDSLHKKLEALHPGKKHHLHLLPAGLFGDALAVSGGLNASVFQMRLKLGSLHPSLAYLSQHCLLAGLAEKPTLGAKATDEQKLQFNNAHARVWAEFGWEVFFEDNFVHFRGSEIPHLQLGGAPDDVHVFKLVCFGLVRKTGFFSGVALFVLPHHLPLLFPTPFSAAPRQW